MTNAFTQAYQEKQQQEADRKAQEILAREQRQREQDQEQARLAKEIFEGMGVPANQVDEDGRWNHPEYPLVVELRRISFYNETRTAAYPCYSYTWRICYVGSLLKKLELVWRNAYSLLPNSLKMHHDYKGSASYTYFGRPLSDPNGEFVNGLLNDMVEIGKHLHKYEEWCRSLDTEYRDFIKALRMRSHAARKNRRERLEREKRFAFKEKQYDIACEIDDNARDILKYFEGRRLAREREFAALRRQIRKQYALSAHITRIVDAAVKRALADQSGAVGDG